MKHSPSFFLTLLATFATLSQVHSESLPWGEFKGRIQAEFSDDGRTITLLKDLIYIDQKNNAWIAPKGTVVDGASIPRAFWTAIGTPLTGKYRDASVIHDYYCYKRSRSWEDVHVAFYNAMKCRGVDNLQAKLMYFAVYHFGPRWGANSDKLFYAEPEIDRSDVPKISQWIKDQQPDLKEIERAKPRTLISSPK